MRSVTAILLLFFAGHLSIQAQTAEEAEEVYLDFSQARLEANASQIIQEGEKLMTMLDKFGPNRKTFITFYLANAYENNGQLEKAVPLYLKVIEAEPDYYVTYRALGHYYLSQSYGVMNKINNSKNTAERQKLEEEYQNIMAKALTYLEKDYACDRYEGSLEVINKLMKILGDKAKPDEFEQRIAKLSENCVTLLLDYEQ